MRYPRVVYGIRHNVTQRIYIGSSYDVEKRYRNHISRLRCGSHPVPDMQADFDKYGEDYTLLLLDKIGEIRENHKEYDWMKAFNSRTRGLGYNYLDKTADTAAKREKAELLSYVRNLTPEQAELLWCHLPEIWDCIMSNRTNISPHRLKHQPKRKWSNETYL